VNSPEELDAAKDAYQLARQADRKVVKVSAAD
jgi:hypothetical protein